MTLPSFRYQPYYCEENIWQLAAHPAFAGRRLEVVFVSNAERTVAMWHQRAAPPGAAMVWDYHVFAIAHDPCEVWDLDTDLGMPVPAADYLAASFRADVAPEHAPRFRVVEAPVFARAFASDRSHMRDRRGAFMKEPPPWPAIGAAGEASNLMRFVDTTKDFLGAVVDLDTLRARCLGF